MKDEAPQASPSEATKKNTPSGLVLPDQILPPNLFAIPVNNAVIYPTLMAPLIVSVPKFVATVEEAINRQRILGLVLSQEVEVTDKISPQEVHRIGVVVKIIKRIKLPDGSVNLLVHSIKRFRWKSSLADNPHWVFEVEYLDDQLEKSVEMDALTRAVIASVKKLSETNPFFTEEMKLAMINAPGPGVVADLVAFALALPKTESQSFLETQSVKARFENLLLHLKKEQDLSDIQKKIQEDVNSKINTLQREYFLKEQLKVIKKELGIEEEDKEKSARGFKERILEAKMPAEAQKAALEELQKFETLSEQSPEYNVSRNYLETLCSLPWSKETPDNLNLDHARQVLNEDHYGLEKVKDRIVEFLAVRSLQAKKKGSVLCLVGPPGVGKTSVGKSIAKTMGRNFYRFSLGGMRDEAEIKGHRRTYVGAMPGKILQAVKRAGSKNAVLMLDEIDKLGASFQGDPASALLEVLDPEQNHGFLDHYLDIPFDLSQVLFIATANNLSTIPAPLLDRMEVIELPGYTLEEKEEIANRYVIPKILKETGVDSKAMRIEKLALRQILMDYAREPGLRTFQQQIEEITRKVATQLVAKDQAATANKPEGSSKRMRKPTVIRKDELVEWLGPARFYNEFAERIQTPGVVVGLAWTSMGGDILFVETTHVPGTGQLKLTGKMGDVMTESASIAWSYVKRSLHLEGKVSAEYFKDKDFHLHIPAGAIPKDGPSAGITMATALYSYMTSRKSRQRLAMTGELSLTGKVLPVGGIKEKLLAAKRSGVQTVLLPALNKKDLHEIPKYVTDGLSIHWVSRFEEVLEVALEPEIKPMPLQKTSVAVKLFKKEKMAKESRVLRRLSQKPQKVIKSSKTKRALQ